MLRYDVINEVARKIGARTYLEIGVQSGDTFRRVEVAKKVGVDPHDGSQATVFKTSEAFFETPEADGPWDLVFVDGLHERGAALADLWASAARLSPRGAIVVHDCSPPTKESASPTLSAGTWCGEVWRAWVEFCAIHPLGASSFVVDTDLGCGVLGGTWSPVRRPVPSPGDADLPWEEFAARRRELLGLVSPAEFLARLST